MLDAVEEVEDERPGNRQLETTLDHHGQGGEGGGHAGGLEVPAGQGSDNVGDGVAVQAAGEDHAGEALEDGAAEEGLALVVDLEVGRDGAGAPLLCEEAVGIGMAQGLGRGRADLGG